MPVSRPSDDEEQPHADKTGLCIEILRCDVPDQGVAASVTMHTMHASSSDDAEVCFERIAPMSEFESVITRGMTPISEQHRERAVLVGVDRPGANWPIDSSLAELERLVDTAGADVVATTIQNSTRRIRVPSWAREKPRKLLSLLELIAPILLCSMTNSRRRSKPTLRRRWASL